MVMLVLLFPSEHGHGLSRCHPSVLSVMNGHFIPIVAIREYVLEVGLQDTINYSQHGLHTKITLS